MRKAGKTVALTALALLAGCAPHSRPLALHAAQPAQAKPVRQKRVPLTLSIAGVHFDQITRPQAVSELESRGFHPLRISLRYACDTFTPPAAPRSAARLSVCWVRRQPGDAPRWAEAWLTYPPSRDGVIRTLRFSTLLHTLAHRFGDVGRFWLHQPGPESALWRVAGGRGLVHLTQGFPRPTMRLRIADTRALHALLSLAHRRAAARQAADDPLAAHPLPPAGQRAHHTSVRPAPVAVTPPRPGAGFPLATAFYPQSAQRLGLEGAASVQVCVDPHGNVRSASIARSSGSATLDRAALRYARATSGHWRPARRGRTPVGECTTLPVQFSITSF